MHVGVEKIYKLKLNCTEIRVWYFFHPYLGYMNTWHSPVSKHRDRIMKYYEHKKMNNKPMTHFADTEFASYNENGTNNIKLRKRHNNHQYKIIAKVWLGKMQYG